MKTPKLKKLILSMAMVIAVSLSGYMMESASSDEVKSYASDWFYVTLGSETTIDHNLGTKDLMVQVLYAETYGGTPYACAMYNTDSGEHNGPQVEITSADQLVVKAGSGWVFKAMGWPDPGKTSGYYKLLAIEAFGPTYTISGHARDKNNDPVVGATITITSSRLPGPIDLPPTDNSGYYESELLPPGIYKITGSHPSYPFVPQEVTLSSNLDISFYTITGSVNRYGAEPNAGVNGIDIKISGGNYQPRFNTTMTTSDNDGGVHGYYEKQGVGNGTYAIEALNPQSVADFTADVTSGAAPLTVDFSDNSRHLTSWQWDFNNDSVIDSTGQDPPPYTYTSPGTYTVTLTATGPYGNDTETKPDYITVTPEEVKTYASDWFYVTTGSETTINHNLGTKDLMVQVLYAETDGGTPYACAMYYTDSGQLNGPQVKITSNNQLVVRAGDSYVFKSTQGPDHKTSGYYKLLAIKIEPLEPDDTFSPAFQRDEIDCDAMAYNTDSAQGITYPVESRALMFDGSGYVDCASDNASFNITGDMTLSTWVKFYSLQGFHTIVSKDQGGGQTNKWVFGYINDYAGISNTLAFHIEGSGAIWLKSSNWTPQLGEWYHVAVSKNGNNYTFYVNGEEYGTDSTTTSLPTVDYPLLMGRAEDQFYLNGSMDEVTIYDRTLQQSEIQSLRDSGPIPDANLVGYYSFDDGTARNEISGNYGVLYGGVTPTWRIQSLEENALTFNGANSYVDCGSMPSLNITGNITVAAWMKITGRTAWGPIFTKAHGETNSGYSLELHDNGTTILFGIGDGDWQLAISNPSAPLQLNTWYHVVGTYDGTNIRVYLNGDLAGGPQPQGALHSSSPATATIGRHSELAEPGRFFNGVIDEVVVYDRTLNESEIESLMTNGPAMPDTNLVVYYSFDTE